MWKTFDDDLVVELEDDLPPGSSSWEDRLELYEHLGVIEVVRFLEREARGRRLRAWDFYSGRLVERVVHEERTLSRVVGHYWTVADPGVSADERGLRLEDREGRVVMQASAVRRMWRMASAVEALGGRALC
jgi:hypothetical protein